MKFTLYNWAGCQKAENAIIKFGYTHNSIVEDDILVVAKKFFDEGLNFAVCQFKPLQESKKGPTLKETTYILYIDSKRFTQR